MNQNDTGQDRQANVEQNLRQKVHELTRAHLTVHTDGSTGEVRTMRAKSDTKGATAFEEMPLLEQVRQERVSGTRKSGASGTGSRAPVAIQALVLWNEIQESLNTRIIQIDGRDRPDLSPEKKLQRWAAHTLSDTSGELQQECLKNIVAWAAAIRTLLHPVRKTEIVGTCPACHESHAWAWNEDEWVRNTALTAVGLDVSCGACGTQWCGAEAVSGLAATLSEAA